MAERAVDGRRSVAAIAVVEWMVADVQLFLDEWRYSQTILISPTVDSIAEAPGSKGKQ